MRKLLALATTLLSLSATAFSSEFSQDSAFSVLKTLVVDIGPRPMGSPAERRAMEFVVAKFREYGCDSAFVVPLTVAAGVNTKSGIAIGVKKGKSDRIIVIGGHIDSSGPDVPGANDDGSGTACVVELARVLCMRENESTIYFCCWGGEEQGLRGSTHFVDHFSLIDNVDLMFQIDMADGAGELQADPDGGNASAPRWLVEAAFDVFYNETHHRGLVYPTTLATLNLAAGGAFGSDHEAFLEKGIPAIDFTSDVTHPIHTPQDHLENFTATGLQRTGDLVLKLFERFDGRVPSRTTERYQLVHVGESVWFVSYPLLWALIVFSAFASFLAFASLRKRRPQPDPPYARVKWSGLKVLIATLIVQIFIWQSETLLGAIKGQRFPWVNNFQGYWLFGVLSGVLGLWLVLQLTKRYRLTDDAFKFARTAFVMLFLFTVLASVLNPELGSYVAIALLLFSAAVLVRQPWLTFLLFTVSVVVAHRLVLFDGMELFQRSLSMNTFSKWWQKTLYEVPFILVYGTFALPFVFGAAAIYRDSHATFLKWFRGSGGLVTVCALILLVGGYLLAQSSYDRKWYDVVRIEQRHTLTSDSSEIELRGSEALNGLRGMISGRDTTITSFSNYSSIVAYEEVDWCSTHAVTGSLSRLNDSTWSMTRLVALSSAFRPYRIEATFESTEPFSVESPWSHGARTSSFGEPETDRRKRFVWFAFPDTHIVLPVTFALHDSQKVNEEFKFTFDSLSFPIHLQREFTNVSYRTIVTSKGSFAVEKEMAAR